MAAGMGGSGRWVGFQVSMILDPFQRLNLNWTAIV